MLFCISRNITIPGGTTMRKKNYKGRCEKKFVPKCNEIFKEYDAVQNAQEERSKATKMAGTYLTE